MGRGHQTSNSMRHLIQILLPCLVSALQLDQGGLEALQGLADVKVGGGGGGGDERTEPKQSRAPKLFYVSTQSSTTTLTTFSLCWVSSSTAVTVACGRKKRMITYDPIEGEEEEFQVAASKSSVQPSVDELAEDEVDIEGSKNKLNASREGKFLVYWMTTTSITTITSYSQTRTLASVVCTPSNYGYVECG